MPEGWYWRSLGDREVLSEIKPGFACGKKDVVGGAPQLRMNNISRDGFLDMTLVRRIPISIAEKTNKWLEIGDVVFNNTNSTELVGKSLVFPGWSERCTFSNHLTRLRCNTNTVTTEWLYFCLRELWLCGYFAANCTEFIGQSAFNKDKLEEVKIPIPPLEEQKQIVTRIEDLTKRVEQARKLRKEAVAEVEKYIPSEIAKIFDEGASDGWITKKIKDVCEHPQYGYTESANLSQVGPKFLRITDIQDGKVKWEDVPFCECEEIDKYRLKTGDIVFARTGATTGKSFIVKDPPEAVFASYLIRLRASDAILPEFLAWYFQSSSYWHSVSSSIEDGNRPNMNGTKLANMEIPYPENLTEQHRIVDYLDSLQFKLDQIKKLQNETEGKLDRFTPALLAKAFKGEL